MSFSLFYIHRKWLGLLTLIYILYDQIRSVCRIVRSRVETYSRLHVIMDVFSVSTSALFHCFHWIMSHTFFDLSFVAFVFVHKSPVILYDNVYNLYRLFINEWLMRQMELVWALLTQLVIIHYPSEFCSRCIWAYLHIYIVLSTCDSITQDVTVRCKQGLYLCWGCYSSYVSVYLTFGAHGSPLGKDTRSEEGWGIGGAMTSSRSKGNVSASREFSLSSLSSSSSRVSSVLKGSFSLKASRFSCFIRAWWRQVEENGEGQNGELEWGGQDKGRGQKQWVLSYAMQCANKLITNKCPSVSCLVLLNWRGVNNGLQWNGGGGVSETTLCSLRVRLCCWSMMSQAEVGGDEALMLFITLMLSSGRQGKPSSALLLTFRPCSCSKPPNVN